MKPKLYTVGKVSELLSCHPKTVRRLIDDGQLKGCKVRGGLRILADSLDSYIKRQILDFQTRDGIDVDGEI